MVARAVAAVVVAASAAEIGRKARVPAQIALAATGHATIGHGTIGHAAILAVTTGLGAIGRGMIARAGILRVMTGPAATVRVAVLPAPIGLGVTRSVDGGEAPCPLAVAVDDGQRPAS